ncbi:MAG: hypothetical protein ONB42_20070 [candidate division KSB1 bacterium]|nr:hypothetical protein [candidate division KSB1 bacterium]
MNLSLEMKRRQFLSQMGDLFAIVKESDSKSGAAERFAKALAGTKMQKTAIRGLESLAWSTDSVADILDYIKMRAGRDRGRQEWASEGVGPKLANLLRDLDSHAKQFYEKNKPETDDDVRQLHLQLCREFIKHLTALYEFHKSGVMAHD